MDKTPLHALRMHQLAALQALESHFTKHESASTTSHHEDTMQQTKQYSPLSLEEIEKYVLLFGFDKAVIVEIESLARQDVEQAEHAFIRNVCMMLENNKKHALSHGIHDTASESIKTAIAEQLMESSKLLGVSVFAHYSDSIAHFIPLIGSESASSLLSLVIVMVASMGISTLTRGKK